MICVVCCRLRHQNLALSGVYRGFKALFFLSHSEELAEDVIQKEKLYFQIKQTYSGMLNLHSFNTE